MTAKKLKQIEDYFKTDDEHWDDHTFEMVCEVVEKENFEDQEQPLKLFKKGVQVLSAKNETPLIALQELRLLLQQAQINKSQELFIASKVHDYLYSLDSIDIRISGLSDLLESYKARLEREQNPVVEYKQPRVVDLRGALKEMIQKELVNLPETLESLEPAQRLNVICKLIPYVLPRTASVYAHYGEHG